MPDLTPEKLAELRRLLDANEVPWSAYRPSPNYARYEIRDDRGYDLAYTVEDALGGNAEIIVAAVNALPALLDAAAERDRLAAKVERVRALHGPRVLQVLGATCFAEECDHAAHPCHLPHVPASSQVKTADNPAPIVLPTVKEVREAIIAGTKLGGWMPHTAAQAVLDLIASRVRHWVPVEPGTVIKAGTRLREDWDDQIAEWTLGEDQDPYQNCGRRCRYYIDPATVPAEPEDQRIKRAHAIIPALQRVKHVPLGGDLLPTALEAIDAIDALEADR